jgi:hypothetical protein
LDAGNYRQALTMTEGLLKELKQLDDKIILTEVYLLESRAAHAIQNLPRAKVLNAPFLLRRLDPSLQHYRSDAL